MVNGTIHYLSQYGTMHIAQRQVSQRYGTIFFWHNFFFRVRGVRGASEAHAQTYKTLPTQVLFIDSISTLFMVNGTVRYLRQVVLVLYHLGSSTVGILAVWYNTSIFSGIIFFSNIISYLRVQDTTIQRQYLIYGKWYGTLSFPIWYYTYHSTVGILAVWYHIFLA